MMEELRILEGNIDPTELGKRYRRVFQRELDRIILSQMSEPNRGEYHSSLNRGNARYFTLLATEPWLTNAQLEDHAEYRERGLSSRDADTLFLLAQRHKENPSISASEIAKDLIEEGIEASAGNVKLIQNVIATGLRDANIAACAELGTPVSPKEIWTLPAPLARLGDHSFETDERGSATAIERDRASTVTDAGVEVDRRLSSISEIAEITITNRINSGAIDPKRRTDVESATRLFIAANGDVVFAHIKQDHLVRMAGLFQRLPVQYGRLYKNENGIECRESIEAALNRGDLLRERWDKDQNVAEAENLPYVGLSLKTQCKHLTWLSSLITYVEGHLLDQAPVGLNFPAIRKSLVQPKNQGERASVKAGKKNQSRLPWKREELLSLFETPVWSGCAGLWSRLHPGDTVYHDGSYWIPLLLVCSLARSNEIAGLGVDDVVFNCGTPHLLLRFTAIRRLKSDSSVRKVPIPVKLIDLGFEDYCRAIKAAGHSALFPEFQHETMDFETCFRKAAFDPLRAHVFPDGTSRKRGRKDVDVHSFRTSGADELAKEFDRSKNPAFDGRHRTALIGHEPTGETSQSYEDDIEPEFLVEMVDHLAKLLPELRKVPLNLRPPEFQKFGRPLGRPKKI